MNETWKEAVHRRKTVLAERVSLPFENLATLCESAWDDRKKLDQIFIKHFDIVSYSLFMYALDTNGIQLSDNVSVDA